jgi:hypothetical protein
MASYRRNLDIYQGYNYKKDTQTPVGFITALTVGGTSLTADQTCKDPTNPTTDLSAVAVLSNVNWNLGVTDSVDFSGQISPTNKQNIAGLIINNLTSVEIVFQFSVYDYDIVAKTYYLAFHSNSTDMNGVLDKHNDELRISVADDPSGEVLSPPNYAFYLGVKPKASAQSLHLATASQKTVAKLWGLALTT